MIARTLCAVLLLAAVLQPVVGQFTSQIQLVHAISGGSAVDLRENGVVIQSGLRYATKPTPLYVTSLVQQSGFVEYDVVLSGTSIVLSSATFEIVVGKHYSILVQGRTDANFPTEMRIFEDNLLQECPVPESSARYRFCHAAQGVGKVDLIDADTGVLYAVQVLLDTCSQFFYLPSGVKNLQVVQSSIPSADPQTILPQTATFTSIDHMVNSLWLVGVVTEPVASPLSLYRIDDTPCAAPQPFEVVPVLRPPQANDGVKVFGDNRMMFNQPVVYTDGIEPEVEYVPSNYVKFEFPPPMSPNGKKGAAHIMMPCVLVLMLSIVVALAVHL